jgi:hypothetical protein
MHIEALWRLHECTDDRKNRFAVLEFDEYAMSWWILLSPYAVTITWSLSSLGMI